MFKRKVQLTGTSTYAVSLPKEWVVKQGVSAGQELAIEETADGALLVKTGLGVAAPKETAVRVGDYGDFEDLKRTLVSRYLAGYDTIRVVSSEVLPPEVHDVVRAVLSCTIGLEITDETAKEIVMQNFFSHTGFSIRRMVRRAHSIAYGMQKDAYTAFLRNDTRLSDAMDERDAEVNRIYLLMRRELELSAKDSALMRALGLEAGDSMDYILLIRSVEHIADSAKRMARQLGIQPAVLTGDRFAKELREMNWESMELCREAVEAFFAKDVKKAHGLIKKGHLLCARIDAIRQEMFTKLTRGRKMTALPNLRTIAVAIQTITWYGVEIAELVVDREAMKEGK